MKIITGTSNHIRWLRQSLGQLARDFCIVRLDDAWSIIKLIGDGQYIDQIIIACDPTKYLRIRDEILSVLGGSSKDILIKHAYCSAIDFSARSLSIQDVLRENLLYEVISIDLFETLVSVHSMLSSQMLQNMACYLLPRRYRALFNSMRQSVEKSSVYVHPAKVNINSYYEELGQSLAFSTEELLSTKSIEAEIYVMNVQLIKHFSVYLARLKKRCGSLVLTTDTHLSLETISMMLYKFNLCDYFSRISVSSQTGFSKDNTAHNIFEYYLSEYSILPSQMLHIGDNQFSDVSMPSRFGISTCRV